MNVPGADATTLQIEQEQLMEEARRQPGVADVLSIFHRAQAALPTASAPSIRLSYATGANR